MEGAEASDSGGFSMGIVISLGILANSLRALETFEVPISVKSESIFELQDSVLALGSGSTAMAAVGGMMLGKTHISAGQV